MFRKLLALVLLVMVLLLVSAVVLASDHAGRPGSDVSVYVRSQGLYFDSIVLTGLPQQGNFQKLEPVDGRLETDFGPGDVGYLGGRWWVDVNGNNEMDEGDAFFLCPLLGPGHE